LVKHQISAKKTITGAAVQESPNGLESIAVPNGTLRRSDI
jgi:hypothetical protein